MRTVRGSHVGRKSVRHNRVDPNDGQLSLYSSTHTNTMTEYNTLNGLSSQVNSAPSIITQSASSTTLDALTPSAASQPKVKGVHESRLLFIFKNIIQSSAEITLSGLKIVEEQIIVLASDMSPKCFFFFNQFYKVGPQHYTFEKFFDKDALKQFYALISSYKSSQKCKTCMSGVDVKDVIKICSACYFVFHINRTNSDLKTLKLWLCNSD
jgi:hypothetical protein